MKKNNFLQQRQKNLAPYLSDMEQLAYIRSSELTDGNGRGNRIIDFFNGSGLAFTVAPDYGMGVIEASFKGIPISWRTPNGHVAPNKFSDFLKDWPGGLITCCGMRHTGGPEEDQLLHGNIHKASAEKISVKTEWNDDKYKLSVEGFLRESKTFGENLRIKRSIHTFFGDNTLYFKDEITNTGFTPDYCLALYHCNFGYPLVSPDCRLQAIAHEISGRDDNAAKDLGNWHSMVEPGSGGPEEEVFYHKIKGDKNGYAAMSIKNPLLGIKVDLSCQTAELPNLIQWKSFRKGRYVIGLEPSSSLLDGRKAEIAAGRARKLAPGESVNFEFKIAFSELN